MDPVSVLLIGEWLIVGVLLCFFGLRIQGSIAQRMAVLQLSREASLIGRDYSVQGLGLLALGVFIVLGVVSVMLPEPFNAVGAFGLFFSLPIFALGYGWFLYRRVVLPAI